MKKRTKKLEKIITMLITLIIMTIGAHFNIETENPASETQNNNKISYEISNIPEYNGEAYIEINNNNPNFTTEDFNIEEDYYSNLIDGKVRNSYDKNKLGKSKQR